MGGISKFGKCDFVDMSIKPFKVCCNATVATYLNKCKSSIMSSNKNEREHFYNIEYNSYKIMQNKFIEYFNDHRPRKYNHTIIVMQLISYIISILKCSIYRLSVI